VLLYDHGSLVLLLRLHLSFPTQKRVHLQQNQQGQSNSQTLLKLESDYSHSQTFPEKRKRVWCTCSKLHCLSHGEGPYTIRNAIIAFLNLAFKFLTPWCIWTTTQPPYKSLRWLQGLLGHPKQVAGQVFNLVENTTTYVM